MFVETWLRDSSAEAYCSTYDVEMVGSVKFNSYTWSEGSDHSKWGVTTNK